MDERELGEFLVRGRLVRPGVRPVWTRLAGGVSSDIWRVDFEETLSPSDADFANGQNRDAVAAGHLSQPSLCVKRALPSLKVAADWRAPVIRNHYEWEWLNFVHSHFPSIVPRPIAHDSKLQILAMEFLPPELYPVWKSELFGDRIDSDFAAQVGRRLGMIHSKGAGVAELQRKFDTDALFHALRIEPYLIATSERHPNLRDAITQTATELAKTHITVVHGDVSPKNILVGQHDPIFLDAECAWYGDPAFDVAFCLNHLLLKCAVLKDSIELLLNCFTEFLEAYSEQINWESREKFEQRCAKLLPILFLARVDGKSPVEYIRDEQVKTLVRQTASHFIMNPPSRLTAISTHWQRTLT